MSTVIRTRTERLPTALGALMLMLLFNSAYAPAQPASHPVVRLAELEVDPAQLERYTAFLREEIEASIRLEPGVLTLYAVAVKGQPTHIRIFEMYADTSAYEAHLQTPHFQKYKTGTQGMVKSLNLLETDPVLLAAKPK